MVLFEADAIFSNEFVYEAGAFTGDVRVQVSPRLKGDIVRGLASRWGVSKENILAFGDGLMDVPLLAEAGVRMGINSNGKLKDHVDFEPRDYVDARQWLVDKGALHGTKPDEKD